MRLFTDVFERLPQVWVLLGLLFIAGGLYLGFDYSLVFVYLGIGLACFMYGALLYFFMLREGPKKTAKTALSPNFIQIGATVMMPTPQSEPDQK